MDKRRWNVTVIMLLVMVITSTLLLVPGAMAVTEKETVQVNINTADTGELATLPGIGMIKASAIVQHRSEQGLFTTVDDLIKVQGIGKSLLERIRDLVRTE